MRRASGNQIESVFPAVVAAEEALGISRRNSGKPQEQDHGGGIVSAPALLDFKEEGIRDILLFRIIRFRVISELTEKGLDCKALFIVTAAGLCDGFRKRPHPLRCSVRVQADGSRAFRISLCP